MPMMTQVAAAPKIRKDNQVESAMRNPIKKGKQVMASSLGPAPDKGRFLSRFLLKTKLSHLNDTGPSIFLDTKYEVCWNALHYAAWLGREEVVLALVGNKQFTGLDGLIQPTQSNALHVACCAGYPSIVKTLLGRLGTSAINAKTSYGTTPLMIAVMKGHTKCIPALLANDRVDINQQTASGRTALSMAVEFNRVEIAKILLAATNVDVNYRDKQGQSLLHLAQDVEIAEALLANPRFTLVDSKDSAGQTAMHAAVTNGRLSIVYGLLDSARFRGVDLCNTQNNNALHIAAEVGDVDVVKALLGSAWPMDVHLPGHGGLSALQIAEQHGHIDALLELQEASAARKASTQMN